MEFSNKIDRRIESGVQIAEVFNSENNEQPDLIMSFSGSILTILLPADV